MKGLFLTSVSEGGGRISEALYSARRGYDLNPHGMRSLLGLAYVEGFAGNPERSIEHLQQALRISPRDPMRPIIHLNLALWSFGAKQYANGVAYALLGIDEAPKLAPLHVFLATNYVGLSEIEMARAAMAEARRVGPEFVERHVTGAIAGHGRERQWVFARIAAGLEDPSAAEALR
jgi:adenylate cyclase